MILSHRHRFIFIKTTKTAGTSLETYLSRWCGDDDVVTPFGVPEPGHQPRNHAGFYNHMSAAEIQARIAPAVWSDYFKFCFERNPWDKVVSMYFFHRKRFGPPELTFDEFLKSGAIPVDNPKYRIQGQVVVDHIGRYEALADDLAAICRRLALPPPEELPRAKGQYRDDQRRYVEFYDEAQRDFVAGKYAWEIAYFGYRFG